MPTSQLHSDIPKVIHFFWAGSPLRENELKNIMTFLFHTDDTWTIKIWTDQSTNISQTLASHDIDNARIQVCEYWDVAKTSTAEMKETVSDDTSKEALQVSLNTLQRLSVGLKHPALVKDIFSMMLMYHEGGYFFDLDSYAHQPIIPQTAPHGILIPWDLNSIGSLASSAKQPLWRDAIMQIQGNLSRRFFLEQKVGLFYDLSDLKSKANPRARAYNTGLMTGQILPQVVKQYERASDAAGNHDFKQDLGFKLEPTDRLFAPTRQITMGVTLRVDQDDSSGWRKGSDPDHAFDDSELYP